ncbi:chaplin family protein [Nocardiopsis sp. NPDC050513]|uniref:chaplin family protein n=1 Tax=Nocardiopsis sp. NPDC050513 TaxID=3364338 RepID=UPI00379DCA70
MRNTLRYPFATVLTAGLVVAPLTAALADTSTDGSGGVASGNQIIVPVDVQAGLCGNSLAVLGISSAECDQVSQVLYEASGQGASTDGSGGVASGNQIIVPVDAAVDACGNAVAVGGLSEADCVEVVEALEEESASGSGASTDGSGGVASGNQIIVPVDAAIDICGNSVAVLGASSAECTTIINIIQASPENEGGPTTDGSGGVASGNQIIVPVDAAVEICGNAVSVLGVAEGACMEKISEDGYDGGDGDGGDDGDDSDGGDDGDDGGDGDGGDDGSDGGDGDGGDDGRDDEDGADGGSDDGGDDSSSTGDDRRPQADEQLAVTGTALGGLVAAGVAAIGAGVAGLYFARKRRAAAEDEV